jgi:hypothetical protein
LPRHAHTAARPLLLALLAAASLAACGGSDSRKSQCEAYGNKICDMACACSDGDDCIITESEGSGSTGAGGATTTFNSDADCRAFYVDFACMDGGDDAFPYDDCTAALDDAMCVTSSDGTMALEQPDCGQ